MKRYDDPSVRVLDTRELDMVAAAGGLDLLFELGGRLLDLLLSDGTIIA